MCHALFFFWYGKILPDILTIFKVLVKPNLSKVLFCSRTWWTKSKHYVFDMSFNNNQIMGIQNCLENILEIRQLQYACHTSYRTGSSIGFRPGSKFEAQTHQTFPSPRKLVLVCISLRNFEVWK